MTPDAIKYFIRQVMRGTGSTPREGQLGYVRERLHDEDDRWVWEYGLADKVVEVHPYSTFPPWGKIKKILDELKRQHPSVARPLGTLPEERIEELPMPTLRRRRARWNAFCQITRIRDTPKLLAVLRLCTEITPEVRALWDKEEKQ